ncbi:hypothetical protein OG599_19170 [Streptomyces sp. NBC_01335]|uniref:hypothetical protein n=1 Tax=Streptomyces sp. NBC_01335 TaxID=2903828 RepID=UPI002E13ABD9|nr:hypothetical protein OG599_19170 [Streptomyces sp. NBC_01335]
MDAIQQQMFDTWRASRRGERPPPLPGTHDREVLRDLRRRYRARREAGARRRAGAWPGW